MNDSMCIEEYINYLQGLIPHGIDVNKKYFNEFKNEAEFIGRHWYRWGNLESSNLRALLLKGSLRRLGVSFKDEY